MVIDSEENGILSEAERLKRKQLKEQLEASLISENYLAQF